MYFGVPDVMIATSDNLLDWTPLEDADGRLAGFSITARPTRESAWRCGIPGSVPWTLRPTAV